VSEVCQAALDISAVPSLPLVPDGTCGYGDPMHMHRTIGMSEAAGFAAKLLAVERRTTERG
jgi:2-methylisocitrate lyase-like PEP mutase family enzyme